MLIEKRESYIDSLLRLNDFHDYLYKGFHNSYFKDSYSDSDSHRVSLLKYY